MTVSMSMEHYGMQEMQSDELVLINGGEAYALPGWVRALGPIGVLSWVATNWPDIKQGLSDGWNLK